MQKGILCFDYPETVQGGQMVAFIPTINPKNVDKPNATIVNLEIHPSLVPPEKQDINPVLEGQVKKVNSDYYLVLAKNGVSYTLSTRCDVKLSNGDKITFKKFPPSKKNYVDLASVKIVY